MDLQEAIKALNESKIKSREAKNWIMEHVVDRLREIGLDANLYTLGYADGPLEIRINLDLSAFVRRESSSSYRIEGHKESEQ